MQEVYFRDGEEFQALEYRSNILIQLQTRFKLNQVDSHARQYLYAEIPLWYFIMKDNGIITVHDESFLQLYTECERRQNT